MTDFLDNLIIRMDETLKLISIPLDAPKTNPAEGIADERLLPQARRHSAGLMRVNHAGELCAQALYAGQSFMARDNHIREMLMQSAREEQDHLRWCRDRLRELHAAPSRLDAFWFCGSLGLGALIALAGDKTSLSFLAATEQQVCEHLDKHIAKLPAEDWRSKAILKQMREEEAQHGQLALNKGGVSFPDWAHNLMAFTSRWMTSLSYYV